MPWVSILPIGWHGRLGIRDIGTVAAHVIVVGTIVMVDVVIVVVISVKVALARHS